MAVTQIVAADVGGTHARFCKADIAKDGAIAMGETVTLKTADYPNFQEAWRAYLRPQEGFAPDGAALALAGPAHQGAFKLTNAHWEFDAATLLDDLNLPRISLLNDFEAVAYAVAYDRGSEMLSHLAGPQDPLPHDERITVIGPGTGLGIAHFKTQGSKALIQATEGAHMDFAPVDAIDDAILSNLRTVFDRVSIERVLSGAGIVAICKAIAALDGVPDSELPDDPIALWQNGLAGDDPLASRAVAHFAKTLGRVAGDYALAHGSAGVVMAGGLGLRLQDALKQPAFHHSFLDKGRYRAMMESMPIKLITHPQPGIQGAARAYAQEI